MKLTDALAQVSGSITSKLAERDQHKVIVDSIRDAATDNRALTDVETSSLDAAQASIRSIDAELVELQSRHAELKSEVERDDAAGRLASEFRTGASAPVEDRTRTTSTTQVVREPRTYSRETDTNGTARFFSDAYNAQRGNTAAQERIARHGVEVVREKEMSERALATGGVAGNVIPQYLVDLAAPILRAGRPTANLCNHHDLPADGMSLVIPRGTTGASAAAQATENSAVSSTDEVWANLTVPVVTVAGQEQVSRQTLERGSSMDAIIYQDLVRAHAAQLDNYVLNGTGASGQPLGILQTSGIGAATAFGAPASAANFTLKTAGAISNVTSAGAGIFPKVLIMHPRRWAWLTGLVDGSNRPVVLADAVGPYNALAAIANAGKMGGDTNDAGLHGFVVVGTHSSGLPVVTDLNIPTTAGTINEDIVIAADTQELHLWEDGDGMPRQLSFEQTLGNQLTTTLVVYSYAAFTAGRYPAAVSKIGGLDTTVNGLIAPAF